MPVLASSPATRPAVKIPESLFHLMILTPWKIGRNVGRTPRVSLLGPGTARTQISLFLNLPKKPRAPSLRFPFVARVGYHRPALRDVLKGTTSQAAENSIGR